MIQDVSFQFTVEYGNITYMMDMYETDQYETSYNSYPVNLDLSEPMYLQVKVVSNDSQLVIIPIKCWATPEPNPEATESYTFIKDGYEMQPILSKLFFSTSLIRSRSLCRHAAQLVTTQI